MWTAEVTGKGRFAESFTPQKWRGELHKTANEVKSQLADCASPSISAGHSMLCPYNDKREETVLRWAAFRAGPRAQSKGKMPGRRPRRYVWT